jgi:hypothetical protein
LGCPVERREIWMYIQVDEKEGRKEDWQKIIIVSQDNTTAPYSSSVGS